MLEPLSPWFPTSPKDTGGVIKVKRAQVKENIGSRKDTDDDIQVALH